MLTRGGAASLPPLPARDSARRPVLDWFYFTRMGQMDFIPENFPDPAAMNRELHDMGFETMISVWPRFTKDSAGSIVPLGAPVENTKQRQAIASVRVYPGADATFSLYQDDGTTYAYEKGGQQVTRLVWHESSRTFTHEGAAAWSGADDKVVTIVGQR
jgi:alpha-glucosidase (family GH31 glycosyl hydrolase)